jgi:putative intracellular protease/amidase
MNDRAFMSSLDHTRKAADVDPAEYAAIFYTGGHGVMWDFPGSAALQQVARDIYENGGVVSSVCHGACGLLNITLSDGSLLVEGRTVTGFSTAEERVAMVKSRVPFLVEDEFRKRGANYVKATIPMTPFATADGRLVTGQNPVSTKVVTAKIIETLRQL